MNTFVRKYLLLVFLIVNLTAEYYLFSSISKVLFYVSLVIAVPACIINVSSIRSSIRSNHYLLWWCLVYIVYQFTMGLGHLTQDNLLYLIAKVTSFAIMSMCISSDYRFYLHDMTKPMGYIIVALLIIGFNYYSPGGGRSYGFYNGNAGCMIAVVGASCFLFQDKFSLLDGACLVFCLFCVLVGHSRNSLAMLFILVLLRYRLSFKLLFLCVLGAVVIFIILPYFGVEAESVSRVLGTINGTVALDREDNRELAIMMIKQHPLDGNGFDFTDYLAEIEARGSHNGYLAVLQQMGYLFGGVWLLVLVISLYPLLGEFKSADLSIRRHLAIIVSILFGAFQESFLVGVNQIITSLFFVSLIIVSTDAHPYLEAE